MTLRNVTTKEKVLIHLLDYYPIRGKYQQPIGITQEGMAESIGSKQNTISYSVRNLVKEGLLNEETSRIKGKTQRRKGYFLSDRGVEKARKLLKDIYQSSVKVVMNGNEKTILVKEVNKYLNTNFTIIEILNKIEDGVLKGKVKSSKAEGTNYLHDMPEPSAKRSSFLDQLKELINKGNNTILVEGDPGSGKTTLFTSYAEDILDETALFYFKIEAWHTERHLWEHLANFLSGNGKHKLTSYLEANKEITREEAISTVKMDLEMLTDAVLMFEDIDEKPYFINPLCDFISEIKDTDRVNFLLSGSSGFCTVKKRKKMGARVLRLGYENCDNPMFEIVAQYFGLKESCEAILDIVLENNLTPEEHLALSYMSIHRYPIEKKEVCRLEAINMNLLINLLKTPLISLTIDEKPLVHPFVRKRLVGRLPQETRVALHEVAARYYEDIPARTTLEDIELLHHLSGLKDKESLNFYLNQLADNIILSGHSRSLINVMEDLVKRKWLNMDEDPAPNLWLAEAYRTIGEDTLALQRYNIALDHTEHAGVITRARNGLGKIKEKKGMYSNAIKEYEKALESVKTIEEHSEIFMGKTYYLLARAQDKTGERRSSKRNILKAIDSLKVEKEHSMLTSSYFLLAKLEREAGNTDEALTAFKKGMESWHDIEETYNRVGGLHEIGAFYKVIRDLSNAEDFLKETIETCEQLGYRKLKGSALLTLTENYLEKGEYDKAVETAKEAVLIFSMLDAEEERAYSHALLGQAYTKLDKIDEAEDNLTKAISIYQKIGSSYPLGLSYFSMAKLQEKKGNKEGIANNFRKSLLSFSSSGAKRMIEQVQREMKTIPLSM